ncbi:UNVERIFIED_CONTAM: hypothetical protein O8I53_09190 [Campylobacter lari]
MNVLRNTLNSANSIESINEVISTLNAKLGSKIPFIDRINDNNNIDSTQKENLINQVNTAKENQLSYIGYKLDVINLISALNHLSTIQNKEFVDSIINKNNTISDQQLINDVLNAAKIQNKKNYVINRINDLTYISDEQKENFVNNINSDSSSQNAYTQYLNNAIQLNNVYQKVNYALLLAPKTDSDTYIFASKIAQDNFNSVYKTLEDFNMDKNANVDQEQILNAIQNLNEKIEELEASANENQAFINNRSFKNFSQSKKRAIKNFARTLFEKDKIEAYFNNVSMLDDLISNVNIQYRNSFNAVNEFQNNERLNSELTTQLNNANNILNEVKNELFLAKNNDTSVSEEDILNQKNSLNVQNNSLIESKLTDQFKYDKFSLAVKIVNNLPIKTYNGVEFKTKYLNLLISPNITNNSDYAKIEADALDEFKNNLIHELNNSYYLSQTISAVTEQINSIVSLVSLKEKNDEIENDLYISLKNEINKSPLDSNDAYIERVENINNNKTVSETGIIKDLNNIFNELINDAKNKVNTELLNKKSKLSMSEFNALTDQLNSANTIDLINQVLLDINAKLSEKELVINNINKNVYLIEAQKNNLIILVNRAESQDLLHINEKINIINRINSLIYLTDDQKDTFENNVINQENNIDSVLQSARVQNQKNHANNEIDKLTYISENQKTDFKNKVNSTNELNDNESDSNQTPQSYLQQAQALNNAYKDLNDYLNSISSEYKNTREYKFARTEEKENFDQKLLAAQTELTEQVKTINKSIDDVNNRKNELEDAKIALKNSSDQEIEKIRLSINNLDQLDQQSKNNIKEVIFIAHEDTSVQIMIDARELNNVAKELNTKISQANSNLLKFNDSDTSDIFALIIDLFDIASEKISMAENNRDLLTTNVFINNLLSNIQTLKEQSEIMDKIHAQFDLEKINTAKEIVNSSLTDIEKSNLLNALITNEENLEINALISYINNELLSKQKLFINSEIDKINALKSSEKTNFKDDVSSKDNILETKNILNAALELAKNNINNIINDSILEQNEKDVLNNATLIAHQNKSINELNKAYKDANDKIRENIEKEINTLINLSPIQKDNFINSIIAQNTIVQKREELQKARNLNLAYENLDKLLKSAEISNIRDTNNYKLASSDSKNIFEQKLMDAQNKLNENSKTNEFTAEMINNLIQELEEAKNNLRTSSGEEKANITNEINKLTNLDQSSRENIKNKALIAFDQIEQNQILKEAKELNQALSNLNTSLANVETHLDHFKNINDHKLLTYVENLFENAKDIIDQAKNNKNLVSNNNLATKLNENKNTIDADIQNIEILIDKFNLDKGDLAIKIMNSDLLNNDKTQLLEELFNNPNNKLITDLFNEIESQLLNIQKTYAKAQINSYLALDNEEKNSLKDQIDTKNNSVEIENILKTALDNAVNNINNIISNLSSLNADENEFQKALQIAYEHKSIDELNTVYENINSFIASNSSHVNADLENTLNDLTFLSNEQLEEFKNNIESTKTVDGKNEILSNAQKLNQAYNNLNNLLTTYKEENISSTSKYKLASFDTQNVFNDKLHNAEIALNEISKKPSVSSDSINLIMNEIAEAKKTLEISSNDEIMLINKEISMLTNLDQNSKDNIKNKALSASNQTSEKQIILDAKELNTALVKLNNNINNLEHNLDKFRLSINESTLSLITELIQNAINEVSDAKKDIKTVSENNLANKLKENKNNIKTNSQNIESLISKFSLEKLNNIKEIENSNLTDDNKKNMLYDLIQYNKYNGIEINDSNENESKSNTKLYSILLPIVIGLPILGVLAFVIYKIIKKKKRAKN